MNSLENRDLEETDRSIGKTVKRAVRRPRKTAPAAETLREWAKSAVKTRNKS
jgi:hypothetical protein